MKKQRKYATCSLLLTTGKYVELRYPEEYQDEIYESLTFSILREDLFNYEGWTDLTMSVDDQFIDMLNCKMVVGIRNF